MAKRKSIPISNVGRKLFPENLPRLQWVEFPAYGYANPVSGAIFSSDNPPCCGVPLGGVGTGCLDLDARGVFGFSSLFNPFSDHRVFKGWRMPRKIPFLQPYLGLSVEGRTWVLCTPQMGSGDPVPWCTEPQRQDREAGQAEPIRAGTARLEGVEFAQEISYWGHYPLADMIYRLDGPIAVELRAWAPFIPGDVAASNIPAALFEVHLRNQTDAATAATLAFSFPGPDEEEAGGKAFSRVEVEEQVSGVLIRSEGGVEYLVGAIGEAKVRRGAGLGNTPDAWPRIRSELPKVDDQITVGSSSLALDLDLMAHEERVVRFLLAWYAPVIQGVTKTWEGEEVVADGHLRNRWIGSKWEGDTHFFTHMYAARYRGALEIARHMAEAHENLYQRILAWQQAIYTYKPLPPWLRDALVNNLALIAEDSYWFQARPPLGAEVFPGGAFALNESPRGCPHMACIPCDWYGNLPIVFFFPDLAHSTLALFKQYQRENGEIPFAIGKIADLPDMATPEYYWQVSLNGMCYVDLVDRLWQRTGEMEVLRDFYRSVKKCNSFMMGLRQGPGGPISMPQIGGMEWFEYGEWAGMASHLGGLRLAQLKMVERMAEAAGDPEYAEQCRAWFADGSRAMEEELWVGDYYLNYLEKESGKKSDDVMGYQLDGEWAARFHGFAGVFRPDRVKIALETIRRCNIALAPQVGAANFARPDGSPLPDDSKVAVYGQYAMFPPELVVLAMTYLYVGQVEFGIELACKHWETLCLKQRHVWDLPNMVRGDTGERLFGTDYYQNMMLWALPAAITGEDIRSSSQEGGLIELVLRAGPQETI